MDCSRGIPTILKLDGQTTFLNRQFNSIRESAIAQLKFRAGSASVELNIATYTEMKLHKIDLIYKNMKYKYARSIFKGHILKATAIPRFFSGPSELSLAHI